MSVEIDPPELGFKRPFNQEVCQVLRLRNTNEEAVVFKVRARVPLGVCQAPDTDDLSIVRQVKTTAPKHYCVRPNSGRVEPGKHVDVQVLLQALKEEPAADAKCKDKFLVQSVAVTRDMEFANVTSIFEKASKSAVIERKIRVVYLASDSDSEPKNVNDSVVEDEPPAYSSPGGNFETPAPKKSAADSASPVPAPEFTEKSAKSQPSPPPSEPASTFSNAKTAVANVLPSSDELKAQLTEANAQIQRLKDRLADQGLRQRKTGSEAKATPATMQQQHAPSEPGVPLQIVAGLCLLSFLIAYLFF
ncbi:hypothetical protein N7492_002985 [Penicillium capsulatum]|uniref:MSP domain-containing protein n=1 Tax=Penicillium capsulatum TaxID=69766 RepID=A0A9W9IMR9_9EURO|nr:hypothetical protein N7492_002985 [Penicillium capsulatum]KAJ6122424.1 hypothetical protein N7512_004889 [Penicillium capsulatum]